MNHVHLPIRISAASSPRIARRLGLTLVELLVVLAVLGILIFLLLPTVRTSPVASRLTQCKNNLKQIGLALHNYESTYNAFPPAFTVDANGKALHSWRTLILPFLDQKSLYETIDLSKPWNDLANSNAYETDIPVFRCPSVETPKAHTTYLAIVTPNSCLRPKQPRPLSEIASLSQTLMVMESPPDRAVHWMSPLDADEQLVVGINAQSKLSHVAGMHVLLVDGAVRFLSSHLSPAHRLALIATQKEGKLDFDW